MSMTVKQAPDGAGHPSTASQPSGLRTADVVREHFRGVLAVCLANVRNRHDAEDLSQEVFIKAFDKLETLRDPAKVRSWLFQIARRLCADHHRSIRKLSPLPNDLSGKAEAPSPQADRLHRALSALARDYAEPLVLHYVEGRSCRQIAADLGISESAARVRLFRGRLQLRDLMSREEP